jgi:hypothetical protein
MKLNDFINAVDELVWQWETKDSVTPRAELEAIFNKVRESAVHDLAEAIRQRDEAMELLHGHYLK